jgi:hypothetical protein
MFEIRDCPLPKTFFNFEHITAYTREVQVRLVDVPFFDDLSIFFLLKAPLIRLVRRML